MFPFLSILLFVFLSIVHCQDPRKRLIINAMDYPKDDEIACNLKRSPSQEDMGPFWANRGKKDPTYTQERLYVEEPRWFMVRKNGDDEPFFNSRGKKPLYWRSFKYTYDNSYRSRRDRRDFVNDMDIDPAFFAARGKKAIAKF
ncbi:unnamed protein product [Ceutorhynchus assimilis]|uniref:Uncharacterized protein n=1 Tax=Ceutorhynchus assimilis TaxID=467358 RepID=A0A9P0DG77_9CUCU|nr:unnamed protein product [Ceutorhynchus assimilis]